MTQVEAVPNTYEGTKKKNLAATGISVLYVSLGLVFEFFFILGSMCSEKALHDQRYRLETLRYEIFVNKT